MNSGQRFLICGRSLIKRQTDSLSFRSVCLSGLSTLSLCPSVWSVTFVCLISLSVCQSVCLFVSLVWLSVQSFCVSSLSIFRFCLVCLVFLSISSYLTFLHQFGKSVLFVCLSVCLPVCVCVRSVCLVWLVVLVSLVYLVCPPVYHVCLSSLSICSLCLCSLSVSLVCLSVWSVYLSGLSVL